MTGQYFGDKLQCLTMSEFLFPLASHAHPTLGICFKDTRAGGCEIHTKVSL